VFEFGGHRPLRRSPDESSCSQHRETTLEDLRIPQGNRLELLLESPWSHKHPHQRSYRLCFTWSSARPEAVEHRSLPLNSRPESAMPHLSPINSVSSCARSFPSIPWALPLPVAKEIDVPQTRISSILKRAPELYRLTPTCACVRFLGLSEGYLLRARSCPTSKIAAPGHCRSCKQDPATASSSNRQLNGWPCWLLVDTRQE